MVKRIIINEWWVWLWNYQGGARSTEHTSWSSATGSRLNVTQKHVKFKWIKRIIRDILKHGNYFSSFQLQSSCQFPLNNAVHCMVPVAATPYSWSLVKRNRRTLFLLHSPLNRCRNQPAWQIWINPLLSFRCERHLNLTTKKLLKNIWMSPLFSLYCSGFEDCVESITEKTYSPHVKMLLCGQTIS